MLLIGGIVLVFAGLCFRFYPSYESLRSGEGAQALTGKRLAKYRQVVKSKATLEDRLVLFEKSLARAEEGLLKGETEALAAVDIQNMLNEIVLASGVEIKSMQVLKPPEQNQETPYTSVPVQFSVMSTIRQLQDILYKIETCPQFYLTVQWIRISAGRGGRGEVRCDMAVAGIMRKVEG